MPDLAIIEGNRGLYDGRDVQGSCSTATLARALGAPVLLTLTVTKMTRTAAAVIAGLAHFEPVNLAGVVLNRVASSRHAALIRQSIETYTGIPVLGEIPRLAENPIPERHMGLVSMHDETPDALGRASLLAALDSLPGLLNATWTSTRPCASPAPLRICGTSNRSGKVERMPLSGKRAPFGKAPAKLLRVPMRRLRKPISEKRSSPPAILRSPIMSGYPPPKARLPAWSPLARRNQPAQGNRPPQR